VSINNDGLSKSQDFPFFVIPAKSGHKVKHQRYPAFSNSSGLSFSNDRNMYLDNPYEADRDLLYDQSFLINKTPYFKLK